MRLIDAEALKKVIKVGELYWGKRILDLIDNAPTVDPFEKNGSICNENCGAKIIPHGKWLNDGHPTLYYICSNCGGGGDYYDYFCRNCGARMIENTGDPFMTDMAARLKAINEKVMNSPENRIKAQEGADE